MPSLVDLERGVFEVIATSSVEVYPKESIGLIFGTKILNGYRCSVAIPLQEAERDVFGVSWDLLHQERIKKAVFSMMGYKFLGIYHSHTDTAAVLSKEDVSLLINSDYLLCIVSSVSKSLNPSSHWRERKLGIEGSLQNFELIMNAFVKSAQQVQQAKVEFPSMHIYNSLANEFGISLYDMIGLPDRDLQILQYELKKIDYHLRRKKGDYSQRKIKYAMGVIEKVLIKHFKRR